ncbi:alcohol dehydrogenase [Fusobacterium necrophorum BFTR-2]|nr:NAD(P)-dependent alcohol dehydrogenase [Fusobacterium necrophorum]KDE68853.1 alcohol dehydrogenase [Fusobacterium necrophorum BFTR-2]
MKVQAAVIKKENNNFEMEEINLDEPMDDEVLIKIIATGVCHTDEAARTGAAKFPVVLGHEGAGIVEKTGKKVKNLTQGDHVVISIPFCGECEFCSKDMPYACTHNDELIFGGKMKDGTSRLSINGEVVNNFFGQSSFSQYVVVNENSVIKVEKDIDLALLGPLGCGIQTGAGTVLEFLKPKSEDSIVIFGCGAVGLSSIMAAKILGCKKIIAVGGTPEKLILAKKVGATHTIDRKKTISVSDEVKKITNSGANYGIDTTGNEEMINIALNSLCKCGHLVLLGMCDSLTINPNSMMVDSKSISAIAEGCVNPHKFIPKLLMYYKENKFPFDKLIKFYNFDDINQAFEDLRSGKVIKAVLKVGEWR